VHRAYEEIWCLRLELRGWNESFSKRKEKAEERLMSLLRKAGRL
jgi:hypothetical protein